MDKGLMGAAFPQYTPLQPDFSVMNFSVVFSFSNGTIGNHREHGMHGVGDLGSEPETRNTLSAFSPIVPRVASEMRELLTCYDMTPSRPDPVPTDPVPTPRLSRDDVLACLAYARRLSELHTTLAPSGV